MVTDEEIAREIAELAAKINSGVRHHDGRCGCGHDPEGHSLCWSQQAIGLAAGARVLSILQKCRSVPASEGPYIDVVFDGPPAHESGRFIEVESPAGTGVRVGEWIDRKDGYWALRIPTRPSLDVKQAAQRIELRLGVGWQGYAPLVMEIVREELGLV